MRAEILPTRWQHLDPAIWQKAGYNLADAKRYLQAHGAGLNHPNLNIPLRIPGAGSMVSFFISSAGAMFLPNSSAAAVLPTLKPRAAAILNTSFQGNATAFRLEYWSSIVSGTHSTRVV